MKTPQGFVKTNDGTWLVQVPDADSRWGFYLASEDQTWDGGHGIAQDWTLVPQNKVPADVKDRLGFLLEGQE